MAAQVVAFTKSHVVDNNFSVTSVLEQKGNAKHTSFMPNILCSLGITFLKVVLREGVPKPEELCNSYFFEILS